MHAATITPSVACVCCLASHLHLAGDGPKPPHLPALIVIRLGLCLCICQREMHLCFHEVILLPLAGVCAQYEVLLAVPPLDVCAVLQETICAEESSVGKGTRWSSC